MTASLTLSCLCLPFPVAAPGLLPDEAIHDLLAWVLLHFRQEAQTHSLKCTHRISYLCRVLTQQQQQLQAELTPPILPTQSPWSVWEQRRRLETGIRLGAGGAGAGRAPQLECVARGPGREKAWGHCDPLSQTPWGTQL